MKRSDMIKEIKALIRANSDLLEKQAQGEISYGKMAGLLAESILSHVEDKGMVLYREMDCGCCNNIDWDEEKGVIYDRF